MDARNTLRQHIVVGSFSLSLAFAFYFLFNIRWSTAFGRISFFLLFMTLIIGPIMRLKKPTKVFSPFMSPWVWRSELGIWFTVTALIHFFLVMEGRPGWSLIKALGGGVGGGGYGLVNLLGFAALFWALVLTATSSGKVIGFLGLESWKWLHSFSYVIFYLISGHLLYFQFFSTYGGGPDWFGYTALTMMIVVIILQLSAFTKTVFKHRRHQS